MSPQAVDLEKTAGRVRAGNHLPEPQFPAVAVVVVVRLLRPLLLQAVVVAVRRLHLPLLLRLLQGVVAELVLWTASSVTNAARSSPRRTTRDSAHRAVLEKTDKAT